MTAMKTVVVPAETHRLLQLVAATQHKKLGEVVETLLRYGIERVAPEVIELEHNGLSDFTPDQLAERMISEADSFAAEPLLLRD